MNLWQQKVFLKIHQVHFYKPKYLVFSTYLHNLSSLHHGFLLLIKIVLKLWKIWIRNSELNLEIASNSTLYSVPFLDQVFAH